MYSGDQEDRINQLSQQVESLSLANARLMRTNRVLKLDSEKLLDQKAGEVKQALKVMTERNIRLQRAARLLKDEYDIQTQELNMMKQNQLHSNTNKIGPEYEYLLAGKPQCTETCCFTERPLSKEKHNCRPHLSSHLSEPTLEQENDQLRDSIDTLMKDRDALYQLLNDKEQSNKALEYELSVKDGIVKQLEQDFEKMEIEVNHLQKVRAQTI
ncbi:hypothetical protein K501DRAFT_178687 [Backusella circina FSU 941]|nr:hypothetical protein K501DRAFT_178687 [Backusella circina FSU 941]